MIRAARASDGRLAGVELAPGLVAGPPGTEAALAAGLTKAFDAAPADLPAGALAARLRAAVPSYAELRGGTFAQLGAELRRQLGGAGSPDRLGSLTVGEWERETAAWRDANWAIYDEEPGPSAELLALDEVLLDRAARGEAGPSLRFWGWAERTIIVGRSQRVAAEVNLPAADAGGWSVARRISGGGAMLAEPGGTVTYSLILPEALFAGGLRRSYELCDAFALLALRRLGAEAWYVPSNDIGTPAGKLSGAAQARRRGWVLHHTTMAYRLSQTTVNRVLRLEDDSGATPGVRSAAKVVQAVSEVVAESREAVVAALREEFERRVGGSAARLEEEELRAAEALAAAKYRAAEWIQREQPPPPGSP